MRRHMKLSHDKAGHTDATESRSRRRAAWPAMLLVALAAVVVGLPALRGTFVGGDDHRLVLDHVLVNHPSWEHAAELITIVHRDLYQPLPLLSFSAEFVIADALGLFERGIAGAAWLFHLTNILLHAVNALLVWLVIRGLQRDSPLVGAPGGGFGHNDRAALIVATTAAVLFAVHPLQMEVVAWINGRMMLLSTLFALASLLAMARYLRTGARGWAIATPVFVLFCMVSKVRIGLPILLLIVPNFRPTARRS